MELSAVEIFALSGLVVGSFVATSIDNLLILVVLLGANAKRRSAVLMGFFIATVAVMCASALGLLLGSLVGAGMIGYFGAVPLFLGCHMLYKAWSSSGHESLDIVGADGSGGRAIWFSTFILMFSNSGDSIAVFLPLLAESNGAALLVIVCTYVLSAVVWAALSCLISGRRELAVRIEARAEKIIPWMMIGVGIYILMDSSTDTLV